MRVTLVNRLAAIHRGGGEIYDLSLARALRSAGAELEIITGTPALSPTPAPIEGIPTRYARTPYLRSTAHRLGNAGWRLLDLDLRWFERAAFRLIRAGLPRPDVVHVTGLARLAHRLESELFIPSLVLFPGPPSLTHRALIGRCRHVAGVGAVAPYLRENFRAGIHEVTAGVDTGVFRPVPPAARERLGLLGDDRVVLFAGRLVPLKNLPLLAEAFAGIRERVAGARLVVAGDGPSRSEFVRRCARAGLRADGIRPDVVIAGEVPHDAMAEIYAAADLVVLTSLDESFSLVALEAMACGRAVLVPAAVYLPRLVEDRVTGRLYPRGERQPFVDAAVQMLGDPAERQRLGAAARDAAMRRHSWDAVAREFMKLYEGMAPA
ncbi:MAG: glycosyltransferase family 4 protein [Acidobacteria bacterium]|nr:glycosyltransferase family 4 protein [Acidobacteriota bacterium]